MNQGIKVRDCSKFNGLGRNHCRVAIRTYNENEKLVVTLQDVFQ